MGDSPKGKHAQVRRSKVGGYGHPSIRLGGPDVADQLVQVVRALSLPRGVCAWLKELARQALSTGREWHDEQRATLGEQAERLKRRLDEAYADTLDGVISGERLRGLVSAWRLELEQIECSIADYERSGGAAFEKPPRVLELSQDLAATHVTKRPAEKRRCSTRCV